MEHGQLKGVDGLKMAAAVDVVSQFLTSHVHPLGQLGKQLSGDARIAFGLDVRDGAFGNAAVKGEGLVVPSHLHLK